MPSPAEPPAARSRLGTLLSGRLGFLSVAAGLGVYGLAAYVFLGVAGQALGPAAFAPLSVLWTLLNAVGIGLFLPFEQELGRTTASLRALGRGNDGVVRLVGRVAAVLLGAVALVCLVAWPLLTRRLFHGDATLVPLLVGALLGMAVAYVARGLLAGNGRYGSYGAQFVVDGLLRMAGAGALALAGVREVWAFGLVLVVAPLLAVLATTPRRAGLVDAGEPPDAGAVRRAVAVLVVASLASQLLANAGPLVVQLRATPEQEVLSGQFLAALTIARVPVFMFSAVQAVLLPGLAAMVGLRDVAGYRRRLGLVTAATAAIGVGGTAAVWAWGEVLVPLLFGDGFGVSRTVVTLLALSGALFMLAQLAAQALLALAGERAVVVGWVAGAVALVVAAVLPGELTMVAVVALVVGSAVSLLVLTGALVLALRAWSADVGRPVSPR
ncbi:lipopolysaccharide biosynthesis protein [Cellulomonas sp. P4]|uniref:lipopolysaccharide biosynthesis protein n=1 Tax=Cellulomonas sp. P4 TaxID=3142533 RepID=UPI0031BA8871